MTTEVKQYYTVEEFMALPDDGNRYELIEGELREMPGPNFTHGSITILLIVELHSYLTTSLIGRVLTNMAFELSRKSGPVPDVAFVKLERVAGIDVSKAFPGAPDLAIEIMSPTDKWSEVAEKVQLYLQAGTTLVWVVDPFDRAVNVYHKGQNRRLLLEDADLDGEDVLPGFKLKVSSLFS